ncbi:hypothetical protein PENSPDRAFT_227998 [Peniophora sp. CONT]|nr:hypothetical protein PENSPDRAFT_227998 [Peniophora sp. CONT]
MTFGNNFFKLKPPQSHTDEDPWNDISRVQPLAKKEEFHDAELASSSGTQSASSLERGLKRSRSNSSLSSLPSDFGSDLKADVQARRQKPRYSQTVGLAQQLTPVSFDKTGRPRVILDWRVEVKLGYSVLRSVMFNASDDSEPDVNIPTRRRTSGQ